MTDRDNERDARQFEEKNPEHDQAEQQDEMTAQFWHEFDMLIRSRRAVQEVDPVELLTPRTVRGVTMRRVTQVEVDGTNLVTLDQEGGLRDTRYTMSNRQKLALLVALIVDCYDCCICDGSTTADELLFNLDQRLNVKEAK